MQISPTWSREDEAAAAVVVVVVGRRVLHTLRATDDVVPIGEAGPWGAASARVGVVAVRRHPRGTTWRRWEVQGRHPCCRRRHEHKDKHERNRSNHHHSR